MKTISKPRKTGSSSRHQTGLSLVELMISLTIGLILLAGITTLIVKQSSARDELEKSSRQIENGRYATQILHDDIEHAGFYGEYSPSNGVVYTVPVDPCAISTDSGWATTPTVPVPIYGYTGAATAPAAAATCALTNYKPNTAILVVRRMSTATVESSAAVAGTTYFQVSQCGTSATPFLPPGTTATTAFTLQQKNCLTPALLRQYLVDVYYISSCNVCSPASDGIPTLKMIQPAASATAVSLVEGIDNMQIDYGVDNTNDGSPDGYCANPDVPTVATCSGTLPLAPVAPDSNWRNVMAVRVNLLARSTEPTRGYVDNKTYRLGTVTVTAPGDSYRRHAYSELVRVVNPSGRRE